MVSMKTILKTRPSTLKGENIFTFFVLFLNKLTILDKNLKTKN